MINNLLNKQLFILLISIFLISNLYAETKDQQTKVMLRTIGHEFLLQLKDSTSRILAIEKIGDRYAVRFENEISFEPDNLSFATVKVFEEKSIIQTYIVEVEKCDSNKVIHSFEVSLINDNNMIPCKGRALPKDCYIFYFTEVVYDETITPVKPSENSVFDYKFLFIICLLLASVIAYFMKKKGNPKSNPDLINIGQYQFDQKGMLLTLKAQSIELSSKESDLLYLLFSNENKTLEREYILNHVWGDDGNYVGRTLDVFISKLRKKLEADSSIKIINIRGVGYRFVMN